jgi:hypothetical protein
MSASIDFKAYLQSIDPYSTYEIRSLDGGLINVTARARRLASRSLEEKNSLCSGYDSVILKYAPPFVAKVGESAPFTTHRQVSRAATQR